jgi:hypothetical protein
MATNHDNYDPLRNPQVDYERADLSARGILWFLIGLFITGVFIELVLWGMFHFMARSQALFPQPPMNPMRQAQQAPPAASWLALRAAEYAGGEPGYFSRAALADLRCGRDGPIRQLGAGVAEPEAAVCRSRWGNTHSGIAGDAVDRGAGIATAAEFAAGGD